MSEMTLKELIATVETSRVMAALMLAYPETPTVEDYERVLEELRVMEPGDPEGMAVVVRYVGEADGFNDTWFCPHYDVHGDNGDGQTWALSLWTWDKWLGAEVRVKDCDLTPAAMVAHVLWEMTWHGFEQDDVQDFKEMLGDRMAEVEAFLAEVGDNPTEEQLEAAGFRTIKPEDFDERD